MKVKKFAVFAAIVLMLALILAACGNKLMGKWQLVSAENMDGVMGMVNLYFVFEDDGQFRIEASVMGITESHEGEWKSKGKDLALYIDGSLSMYSCEIDGDKLVLLDSEGGQMEFEKR